MLTAEAAAALVTKTPSSLQKRGAHATYIAINEDWGIKYFDHQAQRDFNYDMQESWFDQGYAPALGDKLDFRLGQYGPRVFGYVTENVKICGEVMTEEFAASLGITVEILRRSQKRSTEFFEFAHQWLQDNPLWSEAKDKLLGLKNWQDLHYFNWGLTKDGWPVVIDFSCDYNEVGDPMPYGSDMYFSSIEDDEDAIAEMQAWAEQ